MTEIKSQPPATLTREQAEKRLAAWLKLPRAKDLTPQIIEQVEAAATLGIPLDTYCGGGKNRGQQIKSARDNNLATVALPDGAPGRPPSTYRLMQWIAQGERDAERGSDTLQSQLASRVAQGRLHGIDLAYDVLLELERRVLEPSYIENPNYTGEKDSREPRMIQNHEHLSPNAAARAMTSIQWRLSRMRPDRYGDRIQVDNNTTVTHIAAVAPDWVKGLVSDRASKAIDVTPGAGTEE
jgi:hypothetical protein